MAQRIHKEKPKARRRTTSARAEEDTTVPVRTSATLAEARAAVVAAERFLSATR